MALIALCKQTHRRMDRQTNGWMLPSALPSCFAKALQSIKVTIGPITSTLSTIVLQIRTGLKMGSGIGCLITHQDAMDHT